jgi:molybdopterin converting factor small subunit
MFQPRRDLIRLRITVKYSTPFRKDAGVKEETYEIDQESVSVARILDLIVERHSSMKKFMDTASDEAQRHHLVIAVNSRLARLSDMVRDSDGVSLMLPVVGGRGI